MKLICAFHFLRIEDEFAVERPQDGELALRELLRDAQLLPRGAELRDFREQLQRTLEMLMSQGELASSR
jgi:hypothetical protein